MEREAKERGAEVIPLHGARVESLASDEALTPSEAVDALLEMRAAAAARAAKEKERRARNNASVARQYRLTTKKGL